MDTTNTTNPGPQQVAFGDLPASSTFHRYQGDGVKALKLQTPAVIGAVTFTALNLGTAALMAVPATEIVAPQPLKVVDA